MTSPLPDGTGGGFELPGTTTPSSPTYETPGNCFPFSLPTAHVTTPSSITLDAQGYATNVGYVLYGRCLVNEMAAGIDAYAQNSSSWSAANLIAKTALASDVNAFTAGFRNSMLYGMAPEDAPGVVTSYASYVPTKLDQREKLTELAAAAKSLLEDNEIDPTQNAQYAAGLSAAMGGGHTAAIAIRDNITFEQKLQAKQLAFATYAQALDAYYKTYTATATQLGMNANQTGLATSATIPTVVPFESQLAGDIFANWQDIKNTGQMRDQQIRQTINGAKAMDSIYNMTQNWIASNNNNQGFTSELLIGLTGIRSQYKAAVTY